MIVNRHKIMCLSIAALLVLLWVNIGCPKESAESHQPDANKQAVQSGERSKDSAVSKQSFSQYIKEFSAAMKARDWSALAGYCKFPVLFEGDLDGEGRVLVDKSLFMSTIEYFLNERVSIFVNDADMDSTYSEVIANAADDFQGKNETEVEFNGLMFKLIDGEWKLTHVYTHYHIIEKLKEQRW